MTDVSGTCCEVAAEFCRLVGASNCAPLDLDVELTHLLITIASPPTVYQAYNLPCLELCTHCHRCVRARSRSLCLGSLWIHCRAQLGRCLQPWTRCGVFQKCRQNTMAPTMTEVVNNTQQVLHMSVVNGRCCADFAKIERGLTHTIEVDCNDTYMEYSMGPDPSGNDLIVTSDDLWDYKRITITELDGKLDVHRELRFLYCCEQLENEVAPVAKKQRSSSSWKQWIRLGLLL
uniref:DUF7748 domain-containing protein n=2 Tax=Physcomitrium patens TaxID=3218 RepID=A0A7I3ZXG5_PHYPA